MKKKPLQPPSPLISLIIIFDQFREEKIRRLFTSLQSQLDGWKYEILMIQEANVPVTLPELPLPIKHFCIAEKQGIPFNRNQGIFHAQGEILVFIDDDCWVHEQWLSSLLRPLQEDQHLVAVTGGTVIPPSTFLGDCISALGFPGGGSLGFPKVWNVSKEGRTDHLSIGNCALRREVFEKVGMFDETLKSGAEDTEFSYRMKKAGLPMQYVAEAYAYHEPRKEWKSFVRWQIRRGRASYQLQRRVQKVSPFLKLRFRLLRFILKEHFLTAKFPVIAFLLVAGYGLQSIGYFLERRQTP